MLFATYNAIDREELIPPLESPMPVRHSTGNDSGDVDRRILLLPTHNVEAKTFFCLWQFNNAWVGMALTGSKGSYSSLM